MKALRVAASWLSTLVVVPVAVCIGVSPGMMLALWLEASGTPPPASAFILATTFLGAFCGVGMAYVGAPRWRMHVALSTLAVLMASTPGVLEELSGVLLAWAGELGGGVLGLALARRVGA